MTLTIETTDPAWDTDTEPLRVWVACLACYNEGRLVGDWVDADEAASVTIEQLHKAHRVRDHALYPHEELWCLDLDSFPSGTGEMSPCTAQEWGEAYAEVDPAEWPALTAWVETGAHIACGTGDVPSVEEWRDRYCGEFESFRSFAEMYADETAMMTDWPEQAIQYFDWAAWTRDLGFDFTVADSDTGVFVFHNP